MAVSVDTVVGQQTDLVVDDRVRYAGDDPPEAPDLADDLEVDLAQDVSDRRVEQKLAGVLLARPLVISGGSKRVDGVPFAS